MKFLPNHPIAKYTTFHVGGDARYLAEVHAVDDVIDALQFAREKKLEYFVLGKGSNTLVDDRGFDGLVIVNKIQGCSIEGRIVNVGGGFNFSALGVKTARKGLGGLEFASGIPGTVGGAVFMNAGANGQETQETLIDVDFVDENGLMRYPKSQLAFSYRTSSFQKMKGVIVGARFELTEKKSAREDQLKILDYRLATQPYKAKTAGCCFRNPEGVGAGKLIEECGLKGVEIGGARISLVHANFIENVDQASSEDIQALIAHVKEVVYHRTGIQLKLEVRTLDV